MGKGNLAVMVLCGGDWSGGVFYDQAVLLIQLIRSMSNKKYSKLWLMLVNIKAKDGFEFNDLIDHEGKPLEIYAGAWANILLKSDTINNSLEIAQRGLVELNFEIVTICLHY